MPMTMNELLTSGCQTSSDGQHWEPALPMAGFFMERLRDAWEVFRGRATAIAATPRPIGPEFRPVAPMTDTHVHDCTGPGMRCPCGYVFSVPPVCVSLEVTLGRKVLVNDGFNVNTVAEAVRWLERAIERLRKFE